MTSETIPNPVLVARRIRAELLLRGVSQAGLAIRLGFSRQAIANVIAGRSSNPEIRKAIAKAVGFKPWEVE